VHEDSTSGALIPGATVNGSDEESSGFNKTTNSSGFVSITGAPGTWNFTVSKSGCDSNSWSEDITINDSRHIYLAECSDPRATLTLFVYENNSSGPLVSEATVSGYDGVNTSFRKTTDSSGLVTINGASGDWNLTISKAGYSTYSWSQNISSSDFVNAYLEPLLNQAIMVSSPLIITPEKTEYFVGETLTARFSVRNKGNAPMVLDKLVVGGRLNGWCPNKYCPDFPFASVTLQPDESYEYVGAFTLIQPGNYHFFIAYYIENPSPTERVLLDENNWNLGMGLNHNDKVSNIIVLEEKSAPDTVDDLKQRIDQELQAQVTYPPYLMDDIAFQIINSIWSTYSAWTTQTEINRKYEELYQTGIDYDNLRFMALKHAKYFFEVGSMTNADKYLQEAYRFGELSSMSFGAAAEFFANNVEAAEILTEGIKDGCESAVNIGVKIVNPKAAKTVEAFYAAFNFAVNTKLDGVDQAGKNLVKDLALDLIFTRIKFKSLNHTTLETYLNDVRTKVPLDELVNNKEFMEEFEYELFRVITADLIKEVNIDLGKKIVEEIIMLFLDDINSMRNSVHVKLNSPGELRVYNSEGKSTGLLDGEVKHEISRSYYNNEEVTIFFPTDAFQYQVVGTEEGTYGLEIDTIKDGKATTFATIDTPTSAETTHQYTIDWDALANDNEGVTVQIDSDGDGIFEREETASRTTAIGEIPSYLLPCLSISVITAVSGIGLRIYIKDSKEKQRQRRFRTVLNGVSDLSLPGVTEIIQGNMIQNNSLAKNLFDGARLLQGLTQGKVTLLERGLLDQLSNSLDANTQRASVSKIPSVEPRERLSDHLHSVRKMGRMLKHLSWIAETGNLQSFRKYLQNCDAMLASTYWEHLNIISKKQ